MPHHWDSRKPRATGARMLEENTFFVMGDNANCREYPADDQRVHDLPESVFGRDHILEQQIDEYNLADFNRLLKRMVRPDCGWNQFSCVVLLSLAQPNVLKPLFNEAFHQIHTHEVTGSSPVDPFSLSTARDIGLSIRPVPRKLLLIHRNQLLEHHRRWGSVDIHIDGALGRRNHRLGVDFAETSIGRGGQHHLHAHKNQKAGHRGCKHRPTGCEDSVPEGLRTVLVFLAAGARRDRQSRREAMNTRPRSCLKISCNSECIVLSRLMTMIECLSMQAALQFRTVTKQAQTSVWF